MTEWPRETPIVLGLYPGMDGQMSVVSAVPEMVTRANIIPRSTYEIIEPAGWIKVSRPDSTELIYRAPVGESFICIYLDETKIPEVDVKLVGQPQGPTSSEPLELASGPCQLNIYRNPSTAWRVANLKQKTPAGGEILFVLVSPAQDFDVLLGTFKNYLVEQAAQQKQNR